MFSLTYLITVCVAAALAYGGFQFALLLVKTKNAIYGILMVLIAGCGFIYIKQSALVGESREEAVLSCTLMLFTGAAGVLAAWLNKSIDDDKRSLQSVVKRFVSHYKSL